RTAEAEHRSRLGALHGAAPTVRLCDRIDDREPESRAALGAGPGRIGPGEALKDPLALAGRQPLTLVGDIDHEAGAQAAGRELDRIRGLGVLDRVLEQSVERDPESLGVGP